MKVIKSSYEILTDLSDSMKFLKDIERAARTCYKSENNITDTSCVTLCRSLISRGHEAMLEHTQLSVRFTVDKGISHEIVRHRLFSFAQESSRYCNYNKGKFGSEIKVIEPECLLPVDSDVYKKWYNACLFAEESYMSLINSGIKPEIARNVLPHSLATEIVVTGNIREWRHFFRLRCDNAAHQQMRSLMRELLNELKLKIPVLFEDVTYSE